MGKLIIKLGEKKIARVREGMVIPAEALALTEDGQFDPIYNRARMRYHLIAGAGGIAIGVHTTEFEIRDPDINLLETVLRNGADTVNEWTGRNDWVGGEILKVAGICGKTEQALEEMHLAMSLGYDAGLVSVKDFKDTPKDFGAMVEHIGKLAEVGPVFLFYLQPAVGGIPLPFEFWRDAAQVENILAVKEASFEPYDSVEVIRGIAAAGRAVGPNRISVYTGCDNKIIPDLLTVYRVPDAKGNLVEVPIVGGLLGEWTVDTRQAVMYHERCRDAAQGKLSGPEVIGLMTLGAQVTERNAANFDHAGEYEGCIAGLKYILMKQGLMQSTRTLNGVGLSAGQMERIDAVRTHYAHLNDDRYIKANLRRLLAD